MLLPEISPVSAIFPVLSLFIRENWTAYPFLRVFRFQSYKRSQ